MRVIDSHTAGEPTRLIISGGPDLGTGPLAERRAIFARDFDYVRRFAVNEPRGYDALVGGLLCAPVDPTCAAGVIFFNNVGMLGMCGHGTMGLAATLAHLGLIGPGIHRVETPVGVVSFELTGRNNVSIENIASYRYRKSVSLDVPGLGPVTGDIAWGGNWFFLTEDRPCPVDMKHLATLTSASLAIQAALEAQNIRGANDALIDHIEIFGEGSPGANSRSFVMCPGGAYDRSPCGTGTSAKLACLAADGKLGAGVDWVQESVIGSRFTGSWRAGADGTIIPTLRGEAYVTADATLIREALDPFRDGIIASA
jgi:4-hydroxyproline epimerase